MTTKCWTRSNRNRIDRDRVVSVDRGKVDDALEVTDVAESDVYETEETEYVRKAEVDEDRKETRLQGLKDQTRGERFRRRRPASR